ncbi:flagellar hook-length control protein FliK [Massilia sp. TWP1-3-3]|uniref:flagellar hook-length control protein FliK n=1 Tax=Massilia sp. TWP1-3-3 TaxID=2804573 RepID=UPI003CF4EFD9
MQKPLLPIQISGASAAPARAKNAQPDAGAQFNQTLNREIAQRRAQAPEANKQNGPARAQQGQHSDKAGAPKKAASEPARATSERKDDAAADTAAVPTIAPDMAALMAGLNLPAAIATAPGDSADNPQLAASAAPPGLDAMFAAAKATAGMDKLIAAGAALLEGGAVAPAALPADFGNAMAKLDGVKPAAADNANPTGPEKSTLAKDIAAALSPADTAPGKAAPDPGQLVQVRGREAALPDQMPKELPVTAPAAAPVQQASLAMANVVNGVGAGAGAGDRIAARVGTPAWDNQVGQKIVWMVAGKEQSASLTLNPPDMGPMQVVLSVTNDHATVTFSSATPEVRQALEDAMPKLREMMSESGIALGNASVNDGSAQQQQQARDDASGRMGRGGGRLEGDASGSAGQAEAKVAERPKRTGQLPGLVDTFA